MENPSPSLLKIECIPGYDGGLQQIFHLEIYQVDSLLMNVSNDQPIFYVDMKALNVVDVALLQLVIYATNIKGKSDLFMLAGSVFENAAEKSTGIIFINLPLSISNQSLKCLISLTRNSFYPWFCRMEEKRKLQ